MELHYNDGKSDLDAPAQYNGNISWMKWRVNTGNTRLSQAYGYQYDKLNRLTKATYGEFELDKPCVVNKDRYNEVITYDDHRGNIRNIQRTGFLGNGNYGMIDNIMMTYTGNKLNTITEFGDLTKGFKGSNGSVTYDNRGNMIQDASRGLSVSYNFLDLPTLIQNSVGRIEFTYDASGNLLTKTVTYNGSPSAPPTTTDYVKGIEYVNDVMTSIYHDEGRLLNVNGTWQSEYVLKDHLGNARVTFRDIDGNGFITASDITQEAHYYPFGMQMEGNWSPPAAVRIPYLYNGIEHVSDLGLDINTALFRTLDPALGRWWQIDPKAESFAGMTPYNSMGNNPVIASDPNGDTFGTGSEIVGHVVGAVVGTIANALGGQYSNFGDFAFNLIKNTMVGAINGAIAEVNPLDYTLGDFGSAGVSLKMFSGTDGIGFGIEAGARIGVGNWRFAEAYAGASFFSSSIGTNRNSFEFYAGAGIGAAYVSDYGGDGHSDQVLKGVMLRSTTFWTADGETNQRVGGLHALFSAFGRQGSVSYENDGHPFHLVGLGDGGDAYRTAAVNVKVWDVEAGFNIFTGHRDMSESLVGPRSDGFPYGKVSNPEVHKYKAGIAYIGYKGYRIGWNCENIRDVIQNKMAHTWLTQQRSIEVRSLPERFYGGYNRGSRYHNW